MQNFRRFFYAQTPKESQLNHLTFALVDLCQPLQRVVNRQQIAASLLRTDGGCIDGNRGLLSSAFLAHPGTIEIRKDAPHLAGTNGEEVRPVLPVYTLQIDHFEIKLVDQCGCLERVRCALARQALPCRAMQFLVDQGCQLLQGVRVATVPSLQQFRDLVGGLGIHTRRLLFLHAAAKKFSCCDSFPMAFVASPVEATGGYMTVQHFVRTFHRSALLVLLAAPGPLAAQQEVQARHAERFPRYEVKDLGTLGGAYSFAYNLNNAGVVSGGAATASQNGDPSQAVVNAPQTAFFWYRGTLHDLGTLGGPNSDNTATNLFKIAAVDSETKDLSRQGEDVCAFGTHLQCLAARWKDGHLRALALLPGGNNSYALDMNDGGQIVGFSDTDVYDPACGGTTAGFQFQSVIWQSDGKVQLLVPLTGDAVAYAFGINNGGQVAGISGVCGSLTPPPYPSPSHAVLWERDGTPVDIGSALGGPSGASAINDHGDVSGTYTNASGSPEAFLWTRESRKPVPLEPPAGFVAAVNPCCKTINDDREIVGFMFNADFSQQHAFLWKGGVMVDLNDLISKSSPWVLQSVAGINASGQIAGQGLINGEVHAFLATPCDGHVGSGDSCDNDYH